MKTILLGLDAFDPNIFEKLYEAGRMPNLGRYVAAGNYSHFTVSNPPQSEVSWTCIATGADPGVHGMFDFVHRDPATYSIIPSLLVTKTNVLGTQFVPPYKARTLFEQATIEGYPATVLWWPATFPARPEIPVQTIPGLGTPDILGRLGVGTVYSPDCELADQGYKTAVELLEPRGKSIYYAALRGPSRVTSSGPEALSIDVQLEIKDQKTARLVIGKTTLDLQVGRWSSIFEVKFKAGLLASLQGITRAILTQIEPEPRLYLLPLQIHPLHSAWRYGTPPGFIKQTWGKYGPFLTLGWPQDTTALEEGWISDEQFLDLCETIANTREQIFFHSLGNFNEGVLANVFDSLDRIQHMFLHNRPDLVENWYERLDALVGSIDETLDTKDLKNARLLILSDHGFARYDYKIHLNQWLVDHHYLKLKENSEELSLRNVDWVQSQAYALGLNSVYLNLTGREGQGCVNADEIETVREKLRRDLNTWVGPDGRPVINQVYLREEVFHGPYLRHAPDLVIGYSTGYRASAETGLGKWEADSLIMNTDHWHADHCIDPAMVPGVMFSNMKFQASPQPSYRDIPALAVGKDLEHPGAPAAGSSSGSAEDQEIIEERLKGLGYL